MQTKKMTSKDNCEDTTTISDQQRHRPNHHHQILRTMKAEPKKKVGTPTKVVYVINFMDDYVQFPF
jgi:hypothetical protein